MNWYALYVKTGKEAYVENYINQNYKKVKCFVPKRKIPERKYGEFVDTNHLMVPGYVFIKAEITFALYYSITKIPNVYYFVNCGRKKLNFSDGYFSEVPDSEINELIYLNRDGILGYSDIEIINKKVEVVSGPLLGCNAKIIKVNRRKKRVKIQIILFGELRNIDVGVNIIRIQNIEEDVC
ncbi:transcription antiterminator [Bacillus pseudomycoides]|uniref:antiterminator LoaP n=1 Tax=Bacillus TaxID=1386 RepID=UPI00036B2948|nr:MULTISPECIES: antiterminator LoaP [Bacillus]PDX99241.1 transcription antiterminator [Bacillus pseudomycoides]PEK80755.1 transcription antiterminator [Bacillus pseudomycoides]PEN08101.1 transcription antiterminator [Bacillus pseudomycoides]PGB87556.1 transcription antiterminator [Bacillus pseudomycoides]PGS04516.1 transcription antiterminator [Bacillus pseudomycoides]